MSLFRLFPTWFVYNIDYRTEWEADGRDRKTGAAGKKNDETQTAAVGAFAAGGNRRSSGGAERDPGFDDIGKASWHSIRTELGKEEK